MKRYDINGRPQDYNVGESYLFLYTDSVSLNIIEKIGVISGSGVTSDGVPFVEVDFPGLRKKYAVSSLSRTFYSDSHKKKGNISDPTILGEVMVVKKTQNGDSTGEVTKVKGMPGEVMRVKGNQSDYTGDVMRVKKNT